MIATPDRRQPNRGRSKTHWQKAVRERQKVEQDVILRQLTSLDDWQSTLICLSNAIHQIRASGKDSATSLCTHESVYHLSAEPAR